MICFDDQLKRAELTDIHFEVVDGDFVESKVLDFDFAIFDFEVEGGFSWRFFIHFTIAVREVDVFAWLVYEAQINVELEILGKKQFEFTRLIPIRMLKSLQWVSALLAQIKSI